MNYLLVQFSKGDQLADAAIMSFLHQSDTRTHERIVLYGVSLRDRSDWNWKTRFPLLVNFCSGSLELSRYYSGYESTTSGRNLAWLLDLNVILVYSLALINIE